MQLLRGNPEKNKSLERKERQVVEMAVLADEI